MAFDLLASAITATAAQLLNDPAQTDYTNIVMLPYLNLAILELNDHLEESSVSIVNQVSSIFTVNAGEGSIIAELPDDLIEVQEVGERQVGSNGPFSLLPRKEFPDPYPPTNTLMFWSWIDQKVLFNPNGATGPKEIQLKYLRLPLTVAITPDSFVGNVNAHQFLTYKTASLCARFIGENQTRADILQIEADRALERIIAVSNKGRQQIMTRHRPFRAAWKARGGY